MKKLLILSLILASGAIVVPAAEVGSAAASAIETAAPQVYVQRRGRNWNRRNRRTIIRSRIRWIGRYRYRETIRVTRYPNGRVRTEVIRRVRLPGRRW